MTENIYQITNFEKLASDIKELIDAGKKRAQDLVNKELVHTYWEVGKRINSENLSQNAGLKTSILQDLAAKLEIDRTTLTRAEKLFQTYPQKDKINNLSWSHYKYLLGVKDPDLRIELTQKAEENNWSLPDLTNNGNELRQEVQKENKKITDQITSLRRPTNQDYTYRADVIDVIDGDTLLVNVDLGFSVNKKQRVRLDGIDAKEIETQEGKEAHFYLRSLLASVNNLVIKTNKIDMYGRFVADVFYLEEETKNKRRISSIFQNGVYLNTLLVKKGLAVVA